LYAWLLYTQQDLPKIDEVIEKLQLRKRVVSGSYGQNTFRYTDIGQEWYFKAPQPAFCHT
jgi:hypothetical protein